MHIPRWNACAEWHINMAHEDNLSMTEELGHFIEALGLGDDSLGVDLLCMVFWPLMVMYR
jgi:hypothetical protein